MPAWIRNCGSGLRRIGTNSHMRWILVGGFGCMFLASRRSTPQEKTCVLMDDEFEYMQLFTGESLHNSDEPAVNVAWGRSGLAALHAADPHAMKAFVTIVAYENKPDHRSQYSD